MNFLLMKYKIWESIRCASAGKVLPDQWFSNCHEPWPPS